MATKTTSKGGDQSGLTLLELVTVLVILGMMLAIAIPLITGAAKSLAVPSARTSIVSMLRTARDTAHLEHTPTWVVLESNTVYCNKCNKGYDVGSKPGGSEFICPGCNAKLKVPDHVLQRSASILVRETVGQWHLEDTGGGQTSGLGDQKAAIKASGKLSANIQAEGKIGKAIRFDGKMWIETPDIPIYHNEQGFAFCFWMYRDDSPSQQTILKLGSTVTVQLEVRAQDVRDCPKCGKYILAKEKRCPLCGSDVVPVAGTRRQAVVLAAKVGSTDVAMVEHVPALEWVKVEVICAVGELRIYVNDVLMASKPAVPSWSKAAPLIVGDKTAGIRAILDELSVDLIVPRDTYTLPPELTFELGAGAKPNANSQLIFTFDREGRLDRSRHSSPIQLKVLGGEGEEAGIQVELNGTVPR